MYPQYVYSADVDSNEEILAVVLAATSKTKFDDLKICGRKVSSYDMDISYDETGRRYPVYVATIVLKDLDIESVMSGIDSEADKVL